MKWTLMHPKADRQTLGLLPFMLSEDNPDSATKQLDDGYNFFGGSRWLPMKGHTLDLRTYTLKYPGDPPMFPVAKTALRDEVILLYPYSFVVVVRPDGSFEVCRMD